jgi:hypothetical protein
MDNKHYFTGIPCKRNHISIRLKSDRSCMECNKLKARNKYSKHADIIKEKKRIKYALNPHKERAQAIIRSTEWRKNNSDHENTKLCKKNYKLSIKGKISNNIYNAKRRAAKMNRTPKWIGKEEMFLINEAYELATLRTKQFGFAWHVDHIIPLLGKFVSGLHVPENLQVIPGKDNISKSNKYLPA